MWVIPTSAMLKPGLRKSEVSPMQKDEAFSEGRQAYMNGDRLDANPYSTSDDEWDLHFAWREGWQDAAWDD